MRPRLDERGSKAEHRDSKGKPRRLHDKAGPRFQKPVSHLVNQIREDAMGDLRK